MFLGRTYEYEASENSSQIQKQPTEVLYRKSCSKKFLQYSQENTWLESPFYKVAALKVGYFFKERFQQRCFPVNIRNTYFEKQLQTAASEHSVSSLEKWEMEIQEKDDLISEIFRSSPSDVLKEKPFLNIFTNSKKMYLVEFASI